MPLTTKQVWFFLLFLFSWLLLLLLGESYLGYWLLGGISLFFLFFSNQLDWQKVGQYKWLTVLWLLFLFGVGLSLFFSINLPISLYLATRYIFIFLTFWFFLLIKKSFVSSQMVIKSFLLIGLVIMCVSIIFQFFPSLANLLPGMNLLHATYGHSHLAALLLLLIPLSWWLASRHTKTSRFRWWLLLPIEFTLGLLTSFGRVAIVIGLIQFLCIYLFLKKDNLIKKYKLNLVFKILTGLFLIVLFTKVFFSIVTIINPDFVCPVPSLATQLCKSVKVESRPKYWQWAVEIVKDNPWFGSGPGTFGLSAKKYRLSPYGSTTYAHNAFLQALAEMGVIGGGLFSILMLSLLYLAWKGLGGELQWSWQQASWDWKRATFLGVIAIYVNALFDFDWNFVGILGITMILLALLIKDGVSKSVKVTKKSFSNFFKTWHAILALTLIITSGLYLITDCLIRVDKTKQAFDFFPYFHWHRKIYETSSDLNGQDKKQLFEIYKAQPDIYFAQILKTNDEKQRQQIKEQLFAVDPWSAINQDLVSYYLEQQDWVMANYWLAMTSDLYSRAKKTGYEPDYWQQLQLIQSLTKQIDALVEVKKYSPALALLNTVQGLLPNDYWLMSQPGQLAVLLGDFDQAQWLYQKCRTDFKLHSDEDHYECRAGVEVLTALDQGEIKVSRVVAQTTKRYFQVSQIIRGEAVWQDFE